MARIKGWDRYKYSFYYTEINIFKNKPTFSIYCKSTKTYLAHKLQNQFNGNTMNIAFFYRIQIGLSDQKLFNYKSLKI